jgi:outer membrane receptor protein involved in Fe transport
MKVGIVHSDLQRIVFAGLLCSVSAAGAQSPQLEEIIVTAQKREESVQDVPMSIQVTSGEYIAEQGIKNMWDFGERVPGLNIAIGGGADYLYLRGVGSPGNSTFEQSVGIFMDGVYRGRSRFTRANFLDIERVEVLKGPQSTFFGNNTIGGALSVVTKKPGDEFEGYINGLYAPGHEERNIEAAATVPVSDTLSLRGAVRYYDFGGYVTNTTLDRKEPDIEEIFGRISARWRPTDNFDATLRVDAGDSETEGPWFFEMTDCPPEAPYGLFFPFTTIPTNCGVQSLSGIPYEDDFNLERVSDMDEYGKADFFETALTMNWEVGEHTLTSVTGYWTYDYEHLYDLDATSVPSPFVAGASLNAVTQLDTSDQVSQELRIASPTGGRFEYLGGVYYQHATIDYDNSTGFFHLPWGLAPGFGLIVPFVPAISDPVQITPGDAVTRIFAGDQEEDTWSVFLSGTWNITDRARLNAGLRYTNVSKDSNKRNNYGTADVNADPRTFVRYDPARENFVALVTSLTGSADVLDIDLDMDFDDWLPSASVEYDVTDGVMVYASYTDGFKSGGLDFDGTGRVPYEEETVDAWEIGMKGSFLDGALTTNVAFFLSKYDGLQNNAIIPGAGLDFIITNVASATSKGIELEFDWAMHEHFRLYGGVTLLDSEYDDFKCGDLTIFEATFAPPAQPPAGTCPTLTLVKDLSGGETSRSPDYSGILTGQFHYPVMNGYMLTIEPSVYFTDEYSTVTDLDPRSYQGAFYKVDLRVAINSPDESWYIAMVAKNLNDELTTLWRVDYPAAPGSYLDLGARPRSFAVQAGYRW